MQIKYKFLILTMLLCSWNSFLSAQDPRPFWVLNSNESDDTKKYVARESITLQNSGTGFYFKAEGGKTFSAKIDAGLLFPPTIDTYLMPDGVHTSSNPADGVAVGSIPGQFGVSPTGGASYSIPIESPAGINGMKPNLTLVYNSQGGNGTTGIGWQISGLSVIGKTMKNIFSDSIVSGLDLSKREKYMIDGNTLLGLANIYGSDGATYQTENKTYSLIKSMGQVNNVLVDPFNRTCSEYTSYPVSFIVTSKDGQTVEYGNTNFTKIIPIQVIVSRDGNTSTVKYSQPLQWLINKVTDANGNFMTFSYVEDAGIIPTIKSINYGDLSIEFDYDQKAIIAKSFINGYYLLDKYLLRHIRIISKGTKTVKTTLKQYDLNYDYDSKKGKYFLKDVALVGLDNVKINSTKIEWGNDYSTINTNTTLIPNTSNYWSEESNKNFTSCDIDGDGTSEVVEFFHRVDYTSRGNGNDSFSLGDYVRVHKMKLENGVVSFDRTLPPYTIGGSFAFPDFKSLNEGGFFADFKGDGKKTIIVPIYKEDNGQKGERIKDVISGLSFDQLFSYSSEMGVHAVGDINNDGVDEIILMEKAYYSRVPGPKGKIYYIENNKVIVDEFNFSGSIVSADRSLISGKPKSIFISDFNGDGLKDLMITTEIGCFFMKNNGSVKRTDGIFHVSFTEMSNNIITDFNSSSLKIKPGDFNGDGLIDFVINQNYVWKLFINNGRWGFDNYPLQDSNNSNLYTDKYDLIVTDFNHDGKSDIILQNSDYSTVPDPNDPYNPGANITTFNNVAVNWYASTGLKFNLDNTDISLDENLDLNKNSVEGDFNMDGKADIVNCKPTASAGTTLNFYSTLNTTTTNFNSNFEANQVKSITDGMGIKTEVEYRALTYDKLTDQNLFYTKGAGSVYPVADFTAPINCVRSVKQPIDNVNTSTTEYQYSGAKVQLTGKGFLGFTSQKSSNVTTNKYVVSTTELEYPYCLPKTQTVVTSALTGGNSTTNGEISRVVTTITNTKSTDKVYTSLLSSSVETNSLNGISKTTNYNSYDTSGNLTGVEIIQGDLTTTQTIGYGQFGSWAWCPNKPISNITTKTLKGEPLVYTREKTYDYNTTSGNLIQQISDPTDTKNKVTTTYPDFDTWGHPITVKVETPGKTPRTSYVKYTDSGRFVDYEINHLGEKTKYEWGDEITGLLSSKTDYQDHVTSYTYNGLGQLTETKYANGIRKANVMQWAKSDNIYGAKYYDYSETSGSAPVWVWYDVYGREILKQTFGLNSNTINVFTKYKNDGKVDCVSEPSFVETVDKVATNKWAAKYTYNDPYGRVTSVVTPIGETITKYKDSEKKTEVITPEGLSIT